MLKPFELNIVKNKLFNPADKLILAFSGGVDSVVLAHLLKLANYNFELAHCNFKLRGNEADTDTQFCEDFAKQLQVPIHIKYFDTKLYAKENKLSIQMAARKLRYDWFNELIDQYQFQYVLTGHHANDAVETILVNLVRGTGIKGLQGVPEKQHHRVRPLLFATKEDIINYAKQHQLVYREDSSNQEKKYKRNFIRHQIIPEFKKLNPTFEQTVCNSIDFFKQSYQIVKSFSDNKFKEICVENKDELVINISLLLKEPQKETLLFEWLSPKGFKTQQIQQLCIALENNDNVGKLFNTSTHRLVIDRTSIYVRANNPSYELEEYIITNNEETSHLPIKLTIKKTTTANISNNKNSICIPYIKTTFPLVLRKWKQGDSFKPFGMKGNKKLSDFFKDEKLNQFEKENCWLLCNSEHIIWVVGYRMDERCRITNEHSEFLTIEV